jgi:hypothetical protein
MSSHIYKNTNPITIIPCSADYHLSDQMEYIEGVRRNMVEFQPIPDRR